MSEPMRIGLIGCGGQGRYLAEAARITGEARLVACADIRPEAAEEAAELLGFEDWYGNAAEMLDEASIDAAIVAVTHDQLQPLALQVLRTGRHVLVEKPMALTAAAGQELVDAAREQDVRLMVGYTLRFLPERLEMRRLLDEGAVGEVTHVLGGQLIGRMGGWLSDRERGGGPLYYVGTHALDFVLWMAGSPVERVYAEVHWAEDAGVELDASITLRFAGGFSGQVVTSQRMGGRYGWCDVIGSAGRLRTVWERPEVCVESQAIEAYRTPTQIEVPATANHPQWPRDAGARLSGFKYVRSWAAEILEFIEAIREGREPSVSGQDGVRVLEVVDAVFESDRTGAPVEIR
ncbi:MAG: Gfo/Idh/MocA family oxidoreductase [Armatimonadota bacterium]|nr:Gfo/Idh/MocA family oxidoreductase [Armatimonadota bacterium]